MGGYNPDKNVFEVMDCRGNKIGCSEETWHGKILGSRPFMKDWLPLVKEAIERPHFICGDAEKKDKNVYYMLHEYKKNKYIKVVTRLTPKKKGFVIAAFPTDSGKEGEDIIWTRSSG